MFRFRSKALLGSIIFEIIIFLNLISFFQNVKIIPVSIILLLLSIIALLVGIVKYKMNFVRVGLLLSILFIPFSSIFSLFTIPTVLVMIIGYIRQDKKLIYMQKLLEDHGQEK